MSTHLSRPTRGSVAVRWIRKLYLGMIFAVIGAMLLHNLIIWRRKALLRRQHEHLLVETHDASTSAGSTSFCFTSFFTLVITGFALEHPDTWFGKSVRA